MRLGLKASALAAGLLLLGGTPALASGSAANAGRTSGVITGGGMSSHVGGLWRDSVANGTPTAETPSCSAATFPGDAGEVSVQTSPNGTVAWGIYMYDPSANDGPWVVDVFINTRRVDHKEQDYAPHGSVNPADAPSGSTFHLDATHTDLKGNTYNSVPNACIVP